MINSFVFGRWDFLFDIAVKCAPCRPSNKRNKSFCESDYGKLYQFTKNAHYESKLGNWSNTLTWWKLRRASDSQNRKAKFLNKIYSSVFSCDRSGRFLAVVAGVRESSLKVVGCLNKHYRKQPRPQGPPRVASRVEGPGYEVVTGLRGCNKASRVN